MIKDSKHDLLKFKNERHAVKSYLGKVKTFISN